MKYLLLVLINFFTLQTLKPHFLNAQITVPAITKGNLKKIIIALDWHITPYHGLILLAVANNYFKQNGLEVELVSSQSAVQSCINVNLKSVHCAVISEPCYMMQKKRLKLSPIAVLIEKPLEALVTTFPLKELKGKRVGHSSGGAGFTNSVIGEVLGKCNLKPDDILQIYTRYHAITSLITKQTDAVLNVYKEDAMVRLKDFLKRNELYVYDYAIFGVPNFAAQILVHSNLNDDVIAAIKDSLSQALYFIKSHHDAFNIVKNFKPELDTAEDLQIWHSAVQNFVVHDYVENKPLESYLKKHKLI